VFAEGEKPNAKRHQQCEGDANFQPIELDKCEGHLPCRFVTSPMIAPRRPEAMLRMTHVLYYAGSGVAEKRSFDF
jgi:hypothetical protein